MATMVALEGKPRFDKYMELLEAKWYDAWKKIEANKDKTLADYKAAFFTAYSAANLKWADDIKTASKLTDETKLIALWNELWEQRLKLDVQYEATEELKKSIVEDLKKENPEIAKAVGEMSEAD